MILLDKQFREAFLNQLRKNAMKKDAYSSTTYMTIYNLIKQDKIKIYYNIGLAKRDKPLKKPSIPKMSNPFKKKEKKKEERMEDYFTYNIGENYSEINNLEQLNEGWAFNKIWNIMTGWDLSTKLTIKGGYDPIRKRMKFVVWFYLGAEPENIFMRKIFKAMYNKLLAAILHEGIYMYNLAANGASLDENVKNWYKMYFTTTMLTSTNRSTISKFVGDYLGNVWPEYMFNNIEKYLTAGTEPLLKEKIVQDMKSSFITGRPLLVDYVKGPFKPLLANELPDRFDLDVQSLDSVSAYIKDIIEFVSFMYFNRNDQFSLSDLASVPSFSKMIPPGKTFSWGSKCLGFEIVGDKEYFDSAYDNIYGLKDPYGGDKAFFKKTHIFSEMFCPSEVQAKVIYYSVLRDNIDDSNLRLIDNAVKGLSIL